MLFVTETGYVPVKNLDILIVARCDDHNNRFDGDCFFAYEAWLLRGDSIVASTHGRAKPYTPTILVESTDGVSETAVKMSEVAGDNPYLWPTWDQMAHAGVWRFEPDDSKPQGLRISSLGKGIADAYVKKASPRTRREISTLENPSFEHLTRMLEETSRYSDDTPRCSRQTRYRLVS